MPLHDWTELTGWDGVHQIWIVELLYWVKPRLPEGYRAYIGTTPTIADWNVRRSEARSSLVTRGVINVLVSGLA